MMSEGELQGRKLIVTGHKADIMEDIAKDIVEDTMEDNVEDIGRH